MLSKPPQSNNQACWKVARVLPIALGNHMRTRTACSGSLLTLASAQRDSLGLPESTVSRTDGVVIEVGELSIGQDVNTET
jgi:hypothetical protein